MLHIHVYSLLGIENEKIGQIENRLKLHQLVQHR